MEWNLILLNGDDDDFLGCNVLALDLLDRADNDVGVVVNDFAVFGWHNWLTIGDDEWFIKDGGVVLNCNQSRYM